MRVSFSDIASWYEGILSGTASREDADRWAWEATQAEDSGKLDYAPPEDKQRIWRGIAYLHGIDLPNETRSYLHSVEDIREAYEQLRHGHA
jgi:hypothetical protein